MVQYPGSWFSEQESTVREAACTSREGNSGHLGSLLPLLANTAQGLFLCGHDLEVITKF